MKKYHGFQLIELIISIAILSILITISLPHYSNYILKAKRLEAASMLSKLAIAMEQYYLSHHTYREATLIYLHFPEWVANHQYRLKIEVANDDSYLLSAQPIGPQAKNDKACGTLTLQASGEKNIKGIGNIKDCW